jgi:hypothetical protein
MLVMNMVMVVIVMFRMGMSVGKRCTRGRMSVMMMPGMARIVRMTFMIGMMRWRVGEDRRKLWLRSAV